MTGMARGAERDDARSDARTARALVALPGTELVELVAERRDCRVKLGDADVEVFGLVGIVSHGESSFEGR
jgi:hypothetical protein